MGRKNKIEKSSSKLFKRKLNEKKNSSTIDFNKRKIFRKGGNTAKTYFDNKNVSYDEVALTGGATIDTDANDGFISMPQEDGGPQPVFKRKLIENPLHDFATVNHVIT